MPMLDMPLEELKVYQGRNARPADFDDYWDRALDEMRAVDPQVELVPATFSCSFADCYDMYFTGVGGARIHCMLLRPKGETAPRPAVLQFHGYSWYSGSWVEKLPYVAAGMVVVAMDCRGQGGGSEDVGGVIGSTYKGHIIRGLDDGPEKLLFRQIFLDTAQLAGIVMDFEDVDASRVAAMGGSQGGALTLACSALEPRIARAAPVYPFLCDYQRVWEMDLAKGAYEELKWYFRTYDPRHEREEQIFTRLGYIDIQHLAPRIRARVHLAVGLMDEICPPSTQFAAYNKITSEKSLEVYPDFGHEELHGYDDRIYPFITSLVKV